MTDTGALHARDARDARDKDWLLEELGQLLDEYAALHRRTVRDLARARAELEQSRATLGTVAHDLRSPLAAISGFAELMLEDPALPATHRRLVSRVEQAARTMTVLVHDLVGAVTLTAAPLELVPVDLHELVAHVVTRHQLLPSERGLHVVHDSVHEPGDGHEALLVDGDETKLERLLDNLVGNALKFSPDGGVVRVTARGVGSQAELRVEDRGPGLSEAEQAEVFKPFHRTAGADGVPGVGLGLAIVQEIATRHGGRVGIESAPGAGATFVVTLPLRAPVTPHAPAAD